jgi:hypothetical protein
MLLDIPNEELVALPPLASMDRSSKDHLRPHTSCLYAHNLISYGLSERGSRRWMRLCTSRGKQTVVPGGGLPPDEDCFQLNAPILAWPSVRPWYAPTFESRHPTIEPHHVMIHQPSVVHSHSMPRMLPHPQFDSGHICSRTPQIHTNTQSHRQYIRRRPIDQIQIKIILQRGSIQHFCGHLGRPILDTGLKLNEPTID